MSYFFASVLVHFFKVRGSFVAGAFLLLFYWFLCVAMNPADPFSLKGWFGTGIDKALIGENTCIMARGGFRPRRADEQFRRHCAGDPRLPRGQLYPAERKDARNAERTFVAGCVLIFAGFAGIWNSRSIKIWTSSYTIYTTGLALLILFPVYLPHRVQEQQGLVEPLLRCIRQECPLHLAMSALIPKTLWLIRISNGE